MQMRVCMRVCTPDNLQHPCRLTPVPNHCLMQPNVSGMHCHWMWFGKGMHVDCCILAPQVVCDGASTERLRPARRSPGNLSLERPLAWAQAMGALPARCIVFARI